MSGGGYWASPLNWFARKFGAYSQSKHEPAWTSLHKFKKIQEQQLVGVTPRRTLGRYSKGVLPRVKGGGFVLQTATNVF